MDFLAKNLGRLGKNSEPFTVTFKPVFLKITVTTPGYYWLIFKRGPQSDQTKRYYAEPQSTSQTVFDIKFDSETFTRTSGFYKDKDGKYQGKQAKIKIFSVNCIKEEKISKVILNLADYIGRGTVQDSIQMNGLALFLDFDISVVPSSASQATGHQSDEEEFSPQITKSASVAVDDSAHKIQAQLAADNKRKQDDERARQIKDHESKIYEKIKMNEKELSTLQAEQLRLKYMVEQFKQQYDSSQKDLQEIQNSSKHIKDQLVEATKSENERKQRCSNLEIEVEKLKKEVEDQYSADKFKSNPEDIHNAPGDLQRQFRRKRLIKGFLWWSLSEKNRWTQTNNEERIIVKRQWAYGRLLTMFGCFANFAIYNCFFTGIYNFRSTELLDMRRVPFAIKFGLSSTVAYVMCKRLWENNIQEAELYQVAIKYREKYDKEYAKRIQYPTEEQQQQPTLQSTQQDSPKLQIA